MVRFEITGGVDPLLSCHLEQGDSLSAESNAMVTMDSTLKLKGTVRGGFFSSIGRKLLNNESFFQQSVEAEDGPGQILLAPNIPGDVLILDIGPRQYMLTDGSFLAATSDVQLSVKTQSLGRSLLGNSGGFFVIGTQGKGQLAISGFGSMRELTVTPERALIVDNGHLVAWDSNLNYELSLNTAKSGLFGKLIHSQTSGEGIVLKFRGEGKVYVCSRNKGGFLNWVADNLPEKKSIKND